MEQRSFTGELEATRFTVAKILDLAMAGQLRVPLFRGPLRWRRQDHLLLLDSLYRGYPVGILLLWRRPAVAGRVTLGEFVHQASPVSDALWIVDGQQRITSIVGGLLRPEGATGRRTSEFAFLFDLKEEKFVAGDRATDTRFVPVNQLWSPVATSRWVRAVGASDAIHEQAQQVGARLRAYEIPAYITSAESDEVLRVILSRANTAGHQMRREEVFEALNIALNPDSSLFGMTGRLSASIKAMAFGTINKDDIQRTLVCVAGYNPSVSIPEPLRTPGAASVWEDETIESMRRAINFLRDEARIPHAAMMPYVLPFILLSGFFRRFPDPHERNVELLVRWVWRGIAGQMHMATNEQFNRYHKAFGAASEDETVQRFLRLVPSSPPHTFPRSEVFNLRGMRTRLELAVLFDRMPRHLREGHELTAAEIVDEQRLPEPTLFGPADEGRAGSGPIDLPRIPVKDGSLRRVVGARLLHSALVGGAGEFERALQAADATVLSSHVLGGAIEPAVRNRRWDEVVAMRTREISALTDQMFRQLARWDEDDDGPPLDRSPQVDPGEQA